MISKYLMLFFILITFLLLSIDAFGSYDSTIRHLGINSTLIFIVYLIVTISLALRNKYYFFKQLTNINKKIVTPILTTLAVVFVLTNFLTYNTFILSHFHIQVETFILLALFSGSLTYINHSSNQTLNQKLVYFLGPAILILMIFIDFLSQPLFGFLNKEDSLFENTQFIFYLAAGLINLKIAFKFFQKRQFVNLILFSTLAFILIVVAGEEISWGQRIFGFATPEAIKAGNYQGEFTVHNEGFIQNYIHFFYMALGLFCSLSGVVLLKFYHKVQEKYHILIPSTLTFFYFISIFVYYFLNQYLRFYYQIFTAQRSSMGKWQEVAELFLATGFLIFAISAHKKISRQPSFLNKPNLEENPLV